MIHEITVNSHQEVDDKKRKSITLEASTIEEKVDEENDSKKDEIQKSSRNLWRMKDIKEGDLPHERNLKRRKAPSYGDKKKRNSIYMLQMQETHKEKDNSGHLEW